MKMNDNRTKIHFEYEGKKYTLVYTADALKKMEKKMGVRFNKLNEYVFTAVEDLFIGAFIANHDDVPVAKRSEIYTELCMDSEDSADSLGEILVSMVSEALDEMKPKGNVTWKAEKKV